MEYTWKQSSLAFSYSSLRNDVQKSLKEKIHSLPNAATIHCCKWALC